MTLKIPVELIDAALGAEQHLLRDRRGLDPALGIADELAQQLRLRHRGFAQHVARGEAVHAVGDRDQRLRADLVRDRRQVRRFLRIAAEQNRVAGRKQRIDIVMPGHHVQRMLGHHPRRDLKHEAADLLARGHVMRLKAVQDALAGGGVRNVFAAGQRRAERAALGRVLALRLEEEWMLTPDVHTAAGPESLVDLGYFRRGGDWITNYTSTHMAHDLRNRTVAMDYCWKSRILYRHLFRPPEWVVFLSSQRYKTITIQPMAIAAENGRRPLQFEAVLAKQTSHIGSTNVCLG